MPIRVTLQNIADEAGLHKSTVSLALRDCPLIAEGTRKRVKRIAREMGYVPDPVLSHLAVHRWKAKDRQQADTGYGLAYLVYQPLSREGMARLRRSVQSQAEARGYRAEVFVASDYPSPLALQRVLQARSIQGLVFSKRPPRERGDRLGIDCDGFSVVQCGLGWERPRMDAVSFDWFHATSLAWQEAVERGYRRIGAALFCHDPVAEDDLARIGACHAEQDRIGGEHQRVPLYKGAHCDREGFTNWLKRWRPDAVIGLNSGMTTWIREAGYLVPEDIGFVALNRGLQASSEVTGMAHHGRLLIEAAIDLLASHVREFRRGLPERPRTLLVEPEWQEGLTLPHRQEVGGGRPERWAKARR